MTQLAIAPDHRVTLQHVLGDVVDETSTRRPLTCAHGDDDAAPGLPRELTGLAAGERRELRF